ncbi:bcl-2-related ovarian killer protein homolog A, partial [Caerostris extrusa]
KRRFLEENPNNPVSKRLQTTHGNNNLHFSLCLSSAEFFTLCLNAHVSGIMFKIDVKKTLLSSKFRRKQESNPVSRVGRAKLRNCALLHKKLGLQRLKSVSHLPSSTPWSSAEVALELRELGLEMERTHPELFQSVIENVGLYSLPSEGGVQNLLHALAVELFREGHVTWGRIVALYAMAGALAVDCVKLGHPEFVLGLVQVVGNCVERDLGNWIIQQGGWASLLTRFKKTPTLQRSGLFLSSIMITFWNNPTQGSPKHWKKRPFTTVTNHSCHEQDVSFCPSLTPS